MNKKETKNCKKMRVFIGNDTTIIVTKISRRKVQVERFEYLEYSDETSGNLCKHWRQTVAQRGETETVFKKDFYSEYSCLFSDWYEEIEEIPYALFLLQKDPDLSYVKIEQKVCTPIEIIEKY